MKKSIYREDVFYTIVWSRLIPYDRYSASRILPELPGIICFMEKVKRGDPRYLAFYGCWRDGLRMGLKNFFDPDLGKYKKLADILSKHDLLYKYTMADTSARDMQDVMYWLIRNYTPEYNSLDEFSDSKRYREIYVKEMELGDDQVIEKIPGFGL